MAITPLLLITAVILRSLALRTGLLRIGLLWGHGVVRIFGHEDSPCFDGFNKYIKAALVTNMAA